MTSAYLVADITVTDPSLYAEYGRLGQEILLRSGGRFLARGGAVERLDGTWEPVRVSVIEFPDLATARGWYDSPEYQAILPLRLASSSGSLILVEGYASA